MYKLQLIGNLGNNAVINSVAENKAINFSVAVNERFKSKGKDEYETRTTWVNCTLWRNEKQSCEIAKYLTSGTKVFIEGVPFVNSYTDKNGEKMYQQAVRVTNVELLSSKAFEETKAPEKQNTLPDADAEAAIQNEIAGNPDDDDLSF